MIANRLKLGLFNHKAIIRKTGFTLPKAIQDEDRPSIHQIYSALLNDEKRNDMIVTDVLNAINEKRSPVVLTERVQHLIYLTARLSSHIQNVFVFQGGMGAKKIRVLREQLANLPDDEERLILATGRYLGEGFDDARLDTLFLTLPISWRGTLTQYAGRLHRLHYMKKEVLVYDYVDFDVPVLARMFEKRQRGYKSIGYEIEVPPWGVADMFWLKKRSFSPKNCRKGAFSVTFEAILEKIGIFDYSKSQQHLTGRLSEIEKYKSNKWRIKLWSDFLPDVESVRTHLSG